MNAQDGPRGWFGIDEWVFVWLGAASVGMLVLVAILLPVVVVRMPPDYFTQPRPPRPQTAGKLAAFVARNVLGGLFVAAGVAMLVLPGQGVLTILIGLTWMDFPGKFAMERWIVRRRRVLRALNWIRRKFHQEPFVAPPPLGSSR